MRPSAFVPDETHQALLRKIMLGEANEDDQRLYRELHLRRTRDVLDMPVGTMFEIKNVKVQMPPKARMEPSELCGICGEPTMRTKLEEKDGKKVCRECAGKQP